MRPSHLLGTLAILVTVVLGVPVQAESPQSGVVNLQTVRTLRCEYPEGSFRMWQQGKLGAAEPDKITGAIHFDSIDRASGKARKIGNAGASNVQLAAGPDALTFIEPIRQGGVHATTVFAVPGGTDAMGFDWVPSVNSLHTPLRDQGAAVVAISYGRCTLLVAP